MAPNHFSPDEDISHRVWIGTIVTVVPATLAVVLRIIARYVSRAGYGWDDYTILASLVINWAMDATRWASITFFGFGRHMQYLSWATISSFMKTFLAVQVLYLTNAALTKISILLLYARIFGVVTRFRWVLGVSGFLVLANWIGCTIVVVAGCKPFSYFWNKNQADGYGSCVNGVTFGVANAIINLLLDVLMLGLPFPMLWRVRMSLRQKGIMTGMFLLGGLVCIMSIVRVVSFKMETQDDPTWTIVETANWSSIEQSVGIICACLPTLRPLFRRLYGSYQEASGGSSTSASASASASRTVPVLQPKADVGDLDRTISIEMHRISESVR